MQPERECGAADAVESMTTSLLAGVLQLIQVALHRVTFARAFVTADDAELRTIDRHPLAANEAYRTREAHQFCSRLHH